MATIHINFLGVKNMNISNFPINSLTYTFKDTNNRKMLSHNLGRKKKNRLDKKDSLHYAYHAAEGYKFLCMFFWVTYEKHVI